MIKLTDWQFAIIIIAAICGIIMAIIYIFVVRDKNSQIARLTRANVDLKTSNSSLKEENAAYSKRIQKESDLSQERFEQLKQERALSQERLDELTEMHEIMSEFSSDRLTDDVNARISRVGWGVRYNAETDYADMLRKANALAESIVQDGRAVTGEAGTAVPKEVAALILDAFNGYARYYIYCSSHPYVRRVQYIRIAYFLVNQRAGASLHGFISNEYLEAQLSILAIKGQLEEYKKSKRTEDQRTEKIEDFQSREARKMADELEKLRVRLQSAHDAEKNSLNARIAQLERELEEKQRAISNAQLTKRGTVYIISNVGSFGENVYKIGMTRRTDPQERVDELGVASVPFSFDVHAFINTDDAPGLENELHQYFKANKINTAALQGREFYRVSLDEVKHHVEDLGYYTKWRIQPDAEEYRISCSLSLTEAQDIAPKTIKEEPRIPAVLPPPEPEERIPATVTKDTETVTNAAPSKDQDVDAFIQRMESLGFKWIDKRNVGGCVWVESTPQSDAIIKNTIVGSKRLIYAKKTKTFGGNPGWFLT